MSSTGFKQLNDSNLHTDSDTVGYNWAWLFELSDRWVILLVNCRKSDELSNCSLHSSQFPLNQTLFAPYGLQSYSTWLNTRRGLPGREPTGDLNAPLVYQTCCAVMCCRQVKGFLSHADTLRSFRAYSVSFEWAQWIKQKTSRRWSPFRCSQLICSYCRSALPLVKLCINQRQRFAWLQRGLTFPQHSDSDLLPGSLLHLHQPFVTPQFEGNPRWLQLCRATVVFPLLPSTWKRYQTAVTVLCESLGFQRVSKAAPCLNFRREGGKGDRWACDRWGRHLSAAVSQKQK